MLTSVQRKNFRERLKTRQQLFAGWTSIGHPSIAEMFSLAGLDFIGIDIEHSTISFEQSLNIMTVCQGKGVACLPRIASHNPEMIKRLLDSGADGLIVPMVSKKEEAEKLISWVKYPPNGKRSFGVARAQSYGYDFAEYTQDWNENSSLIFQIESVEGVENIEELLMFDEVDGVMVGPYDLSGSMGIPGDINNPKVLEASAHVAKACAKYGKACGTQLVEPTSDQIRERKNSGNTFIVLDSDIFALWKWGENIKNVIKQASE